VEVNEARRLRDIDDENHRLNKIVANLSLDKMALGGKRWGGRLH
jgi:putative transposase